MTKIGIFLHGLSMGHGNFRPAMIFKDKTEREVLPIWLDPMEANLLLAEAQNAPGTARNNSAHRASLKIFESLDIKLKSIYFDDVTGSSQYAALAVLQNDRQISVRVRAAEAISLAMNAGCVFFTNKEVVEKSRALTLEYLLHMEPALNSSGRHTRDREEMH